MMFKYLPLASLAAVPTHGAGCYPTWSSGSDYFTGSLVSATITKTSTSTASNGTVTETTTSQRKNFKCTSGSQPSLSHCPNYDPSNAVQQAAAWSDQGVCSGTAAALTTPAPTTKPTPSRWTHLGCPEVWTSGGSYEGGDVVEQMAVSILARPRLVQTCGAVSMHTSRETLFIGKWRGSSWAH
eukprot:scaffold75346_cov62-Cyclotella_meneghiniana.AAC.7